MQIEWEVGSGNVSNVYGTVDLNATDNPDDSTATVEFL